MLKKAGVSSSFVFYCVVLFAFSFCKTGDKKPDSGWQAYGGTKDARHYSALTQIDTANVGRLKIAWVYHTGDADTFSHSQIQCNPIVVDGTLYGLSPKMKVFALDAASGVSKWVFDPVAAAAGTDSNARQKFSAAFSNTGRGLTYWTDGKEDKRLFYTAGYHLFCLNAQSGQPLLPLTKPEALICTKA